MSQRAVVKQLKEIKNLNTEMMIFISVFIVLLSLLLGYIKYDQSYWKRRDIPHDEPYFIFGNVKEFRKTKHMATILTEVYNKYKSSGPFAGFYFFTKRALITLDFELLRNVLIKDFHNFDERGVFHNERDDPLTGNLFFLDGEKWRKLRNKMSPTFTSGKMKHMFETVSKVGVELAAVFGEKVKNQGVGAIEITDILSRFTADVIGICAFGLECNSLRNPDAEFVRIGKRFLTTTRHNKLIDGLINGFPRLAQKLRMRSIPQDVHDFYLRIVSETIAFREQNNIKRNDFMDMLIELKNREQDALTFEEVAAQAFIFFLAGYETSSTTMGFVLYELARHQDIQDKARAEVRSVLAKHNNIFTYECMKEMEYLEMIFSETLRMYPVVGNLIRLARQRYETSDPKYFIEAGTMVVVPTLGIHYDPDIYPEPEKFKPERFTAEAIQQRPTCTWLPFGDGPRNCIGLRFAKMQMSIGLAYLLKDYRFSIASETEIPLQWNVTSITLGPANGIYLKMERV